MLIIESFHKLVKVKSKQLRSIQILNSLALLWSRTNIIRSRHVNMDTSLEWKNDY